MEFFNPNSNVNFMGVRRYTIAVSLLLILVSIATIAIRGLNLGLDFTGGTLVEVSFAAPVEQQAVGKALEQAGFRGVVVQRFDSSNFAVRLAPEQQAPEQQAPEQSEASAPEVAEEGETSLDARNAAVGQRVLRALGEVGPGVAIKRSEFVGPQVGKELAYNGIVAVLVVLAGIMIYIAMRFEWKFAFATVAGELHDVVLTLGFFAVTGIDFDLTVLAAILAVDGYSVNDKIVVFDRVRELFRSTRGMPPVEVVNRSVNSTLSRTIMTSLTTLLTVVALYLFGGPTVQGFALALIVGIVVGTLSTIFFASPFLLSLGVTKQDLMPKMRDEAALARRP